VATETTALAILETCTAVQIFEPGFIDPVLERIEAEARAEAAQLDISTEASRKALASLAYKVARSKTFIDDQRKALVADEKRRLKKIDEEGSRIWTRLETLQAEVRKPLTDWEQADKARIADHLGALGLFENERYAAPLWKTSEEIKEHIFAVNELFCLRDWQEFTQRATGEKATALLALENALVEVERREREQAELTRLRAEAAEREQREREERIAREAREKAEREAREREEKILRDAEMQRLQAEADRKAAEARAEEIERRRIAEQREASERAARAAEKAERDRQAAVKAERERAAAKKQREEEEQARREASARIRRRVLGEISEAIAKLDVAPEKADVIASALANNLIPHCTVVF